MQALLSGIAITLILSLFVAALVMSRAILFARLAAVNALLERFVVLLY
jgi:hypothetical protein